MKATHWTRFAGAVLAGAVLTAPTQAQQLPDAKDLIAKYVQAVGGAEAIKKHDQMHLVGEFAVPAQGLNGSFDLYTALPGKMLTVVEIGGIGQIRSGYDGTTGWQTNPMTGPQLITGKQLDTFKTQADLHSVLNPEKYIKSRETIEKAQFDGKDAFKVKVTTLGGDEYFEFFDATSGLVIGTIRTVESPMGSMETTSYVGDYKAFDGQMIPTKTRQAAMGMEQVLTVKNIEWKVADPTIFELPKEIKALTVK
jgi:hypothetical protein